MRAPVSDFDVDVVVAGAGLAGCAAALTAAELGARVALLEKCAAPGGSSAQAGGGLLFAGTDRQKRAGVEDDPHALRAEIDAASGGHGDPRLAALYVDRQLDTYTWLRDLGVDFELAPANADVAIPRLHVTPQGQLVRFLHEQVLAHPRATYRAGTPVRRLIPDESGRVVGVRVDGHAGPAAVGARAGVVLATGGFARSPELLQVYAPEWTTAQPMGGAGNTGDGLRAGLALGAGLADMGYIEATFGASAADHPSLPASAVGIPRLLFAHAIGAVIVNTAGRRFAAESLSYKRLGRLCAEQPGGLAFQIFDQTVFDRGRPAPAPRDLRGALDAGLIIRAASIAELAGRVGVPADTLHRTITGYNEAAVQGVDFELGRRMGRDVPTVGPLDRPPFYAYPCRAALTATYCGLTVDAKLQVLDVFGDPIRGLWAAGEIVGGFHGAGYLTGTALGKAAVFGHQAGRSAALSTGRA